ncbi:unnamed protein product [Mesocestoides corti]|uniref:Uncharacterized protein n=1 Tax=Mesocestoides corti TaxID=53468 RepID=A0A0R3UQD7_MESCO|nr:unnamed protein product [Mesocestoides corti]
MESYSSDLVFNNVFVVDNTNRRNMHKRNRFCNLCGQSCSHLSLSAWEKAKTYFSRFYKFRQMDFEYASWQMVNIFVSPQKLYRNFSYHQCTRNQWARDDPAFIILLFPWIFVSTSIYSSILGHTFWGWLKLLLWSVFVECILSGLVVATCMWIIANHWMIQTVNVGGVTLRRNLSGASSDDDSVGSESSHLHPSDVEWAYTFDIHLNALFPCIIILRLIQPMLFYCESYFKVSVNFVSFGCALILFSEATLPFLKHTRAILLAGTFFVIFFVISVALRWNFTVAKYWTYVKELLPRLTYLDGIPTQGTPNSNIHNPALNGFSFDEEWNYINHVIDELSIQPFKTKQSNVVGRGSVAGRPSEPYSSKSNQLSLRKLMSSIHLSPDEKRKRSTIGDDGIIREGIVIPSDADDCPRWGYKIDLTSLHLYKADSHPSIKSTKLGLTCGSVICGDIANALRQRRNSASVPVLQTTPNIADSIGGQQDPHGRRERAKFINENEICGQEGQAVDGELDLAIIEELRNDCKKVLDDLDEWRGSYIGYFRSPLPEGTGRPSTVTHPPIKISTEVGNVPNPKRKAAPNHSRKLICRRPWPVADADTKPTTAT